MQTVPNILGEPVAIPGKDHQFLIKKSAVEGQVYLFHCPECGTYGSQEADKSDVLLSWTCPKCAARIFFKAKKESSSETEEIAQKKKDPTLQFETASNQNHAVLTWGRIMFKRKFTLVPGEHFIGRKDSASVSAVMVNDKYASTRSVSIDVVPVDEKHSGFLYKMTVHKATNPVYHNSKELAVGNSVYLEYGDIIIIGKTKLTFNKGE